MTVSFEDRRRYWSAWRRLVDQSTAALSGGATALAQLPETGHAAKDWVLPSADRGEGYLFGALGRMAVAYGRVSTAKLRARLAPALECWASAAGDILDRLDEGTAPSRLPFRADIDG